MNKPLTSIALLGLLSSFASAALADSGWTDYVRVSELTPTVHQRYLVKLKVSENPSGCKDKETFYQDYSATGSDQMFRVLLEALSSGNTIRVFVTGKCEINGYAEISSISIVPMSQQK
jgi:hypothetical protein